MCLRETLKLILITLSMVFSSASYAEECKGHVFFYNLEEHGTDVELDFAYFYEKMIPWFKERGMSTSLHTSTPIEGDTCFEDSVSVSSENLKRSPGYVLMKPNKEIKVFGGVVTDMDLANMANEFFK